MRPTLRRLLPIVLLFGIALTALPGLRADASGSGASDLRMITDFTPATYDLGWRVVNDNVMGSGSSGDFRIERGALRFAGFTNMNEGGFTYVRTHRMRLNLSEYDGVRLQAKADGRRYTWRITTSTRWRGEEISYWADFEARGDTMNVIDIPFSAFVAKYRGYALGLPQLDPSLITEMGLMIYDRRNGPFEFHLASVQAYATQAAVTLNRQ